MSETPVMEAIEKCTNVENSKSYTWRVELTRFGGKVVGKWSGPTTVEPDHAHLFLFLGDQRVATHQLGEASGEHTFGNDYGRGYRLAIGARDFKGNDVELVSTAVSTGNEPSLEAKVIFTFRIALGQNAQQTAQLTWESDAPFRPRESKAVVVIRGQDDEEHWIETANRSFDTKIRWGVGLTAAYTAEDYTGARHDVVRTPTTRRTP